MVMSILITTICTYLLTANVLFLNYRGRMVFIQVIWTIGWEVVCLFLDSLYLNNQVTAMKVISLSYGVRMRKGH